MKRSHDSAALAAAIAAATTRFQAGLRRLARTVLQDELARVLAAPQPIVAGRRPRQVKPAPEPRSAPALRPRQPASAATARTKPVAQSKAAKARVAPAATRTRRSKAAPAPVAAGTHVVLPVALAEHDRDLTPAVAQVELMAAERQAGLSLVTQAAPAASNAEPAAQQRAQAQRDDRVQRRQDRRDNARSRRAAAGIHAESVATPRAEQAVAAPDEPITLAAHDKVLESNKTPTMGRRRQRGTVKWFSQAKGYGFIKADDGTETFVHHSGIAGEGYRTLREGQTVSYEEVEGPKGLLAVNVVLTVPETEAPQG